MAFWGVEIKPGKPYVHQFDDERGRLHLSQATLGKGKSKEKSIVVCNIGDKKPIYLCSLLPRKMETCSLNIEFEEYEEVTFSVEGLHSVHLSGFFYGEKPDSDDDYEESDSDGEDGLEEDGDGEDFIFDDEDDLLTDSEMDMFDSPTVPNTGVKIEEIVDEQPANENAVSEQSKKKNKKGSDNSQKQIVPKNSVPVLESEDEDGFPLSSPAKENEKEKENPESKGQKRKIESLTPEVDVKKEKKKKKKNKKEKDAEKSGKENKNVVQTKETKEEETPQKVVNSDSKEELNGEEEEEEPFSEAKPFQTRTFPNGLIVEEIQMGNPKGKLADRGSQVSVRYIGKLKKNGKIFDSNIGKAPFKFRLGVGQVIAGWDVGVKGMRVGDKRRLTIPPSMGYGAKGAGAAIPGNSWLVFDVELIDVKSRK